MVLHELAHARRDPSNYANFAEDAKKRQLNTPNGLTELDANFRAFQILRGTNMDAKRAGEIRDLGYSTSLMRTALKNAYKDKQ